MKKQTLREKAQELAFEILMTADLSDNDSEQGVITVDPNQLFQFYILANTKEQA
jgi:hypothetical protein